MTEMNAIVRNANGIHLRPSNLIVRHVADYGGEILVRAPSGETDLRSIMDLLCLSLEPGTPIALQVSGPDESTICRELVDLFQTEFDFPTEG